MRTGAWRSFGQRIAVPGLIVLAVGCSGSQGSQAGGPPAQPGIAVDYRDETAGVRVEVRATDNAFNGQFIKVRRGTTVTFSNDGRIAHNVIPSRAGTFPAVETGRFETGASVEVSFDRAGDFGFYCSLHGTPTQGMFGGIRVVG